MSDALQILKKYWGYDRFRPLQPEIIDSVVSGHDTLGLMPTGGGKSICFQVSGLLRGGLTVVVTPLISLMKDQVDNLRARKIKAVYFHSAMTSREIRIAWERLVNDGCRFLYIAPERIHSERFMDELRHLKVSLIVVDEAHCISQWGYDFRPSYLRIRELRKIHPAAPMLALTATATPMVAADICRELGFRNERKFQQSFSRDNISYLVRPTEIKEDELCHILSRTSGSAIVYVRSRRKTKEIAEFLNAEGIPATYYHAGLNFEKKEERQNVWKSGQIRVMVATNAFGMGIDKADVRTVIHFDLPPSLEEYYQEAGRAGRDGKPSFAVLLRSRRDQGLLRRRITESFPDRDFIKNLYQQLCVFFGVEIGEGYRLLREFDLLKFCNSFKIREQDCEAALKLLTNSGYIDYLEEKDTRSRLMIVARREDLYNAPVSPAAEKVLVSSMRLYPGLFSDYIYIYETKIAEDSGLREEDIYPSMLELARQGLVHYVPRTRTPYIYFATAREEKRDMLIPKTIYEDRREAMRKRVEAMIEYAYADSRCRVKYMLAYFGETDAPLCGRCDYCRARRSRPVSRETLVEEILAVVGEKESATDFEILDRHFGQHSREAFNIIQELCDEGIIASERRGLRTLYFRVNS